MDTFEIHLENDNSLLDEIKSEINGVVIDTNEGPEFISNGLLVEESDDNTLLLQAYDVLCDNVESNTLFKHDSINNLLLLSDENNTKRRIENVASAAHPLEGNLVQLENGSFGFLTFNSDIGCADQIVRLHDGSVGYVVSHSKLEFLRRKSLADQHEGFILVEVDSEESLLYALEEDVDCVVEEVETVDTIALENNVLVNELQNRPNQSVVAAADGRGNKKNDNNLCTQCNKTFSSAHHLRVHERIHSGLRPFKCPIEFCDKSFGTKYSRKAHIRTHTGEKPYQCKHQGCEKCFKTSGDLQKHIRTHTGERPFTCPIPGCDRSFTTSNIRKVHIRTHTGEKPYVCSQEGCDKSFASATNYRNHIRIHSGEKPYICQFEDCDKRFTEYSSLYKHTLVHSDIRPYICDDCPRSYRQLCTLNVHKRTTHGKNKTKKSSCTIVNSINTNSEQYVQIQISFKEEV